MGWSDFDPTKIVKDTIDFVGDFVEDFADNPLDALGGLAEDITKGTLGLVTLGLSNRYDLGYWRDKFKQDMPEQVFQDRRVSKRDSLAPREVVYGQSRKGGVVVYMETSGDYSEYMHLLIVVADHAISDLTAVYINQELIATKSTTASGVTSYNVIEADRSNNLDIRAVFNAGSTMPSAIYNFGDSPPPSLSSTTALTGCAYVYVRMKYDRDVFSRGVPNFVFTVRGKADIYDPRTSSSGYSTNAALCALDWLRHENGLNVPDAEIDFSSFISAANYCDEVVDSEKRFTCNGVASLVGSPLQTLEELVKASGSILTNGGGVWRIISAKYVAPVTTLTQSDLIGDFEYSPRAPKGSRFNGAKGVYKSLVDGRNIDFIYPTISAYVANDGEELISETNYGFAGTDKQVSRLAKIAIERSRYGALVEGRFNFKALDLVVGDRITLDIDDFALSGVFIVLNLNYSLEGGVSLTLAQDSADIYNWSQGDGFVEVAPPVLSLPDPKPIAPTNLAYTEELYSTSSGRSFKSRAVITWSGTSERDQDYDVRIKQAGGSFYVAYSAIPAESAVISELAAGDYVVEVRSINTVGRSSWVSLDMSMLGKLAPPPKVDTLLLNGSLLSWSYPSEPSDHAGFILRYHAGNRTTWSDATPLHSGYLTSSPFNVSGLIEGEASFLLKAIDTSGKESSEAATVIANIGGSSAQNAVLEHKVSEESVDIFQALSVPTDQEIKPSPTIGHYWTIDQSPFNEVKNIWAFPANVGGGSGNRVGISAKELDGTKRHRFSIAVRFSGLASSNQLIHREASIVTLYDHATGLQVSGASRYFIGQALSAMPELLPETWYLFVGEIFPHTATNDSTVYGGVYDMATATKVRDADRTLRFAAATQYLTLSFAALAGAETGEVLVDDYRLEIVDGTEPTIEELCAARQPQTTNLVDGDSMSWASPTPDYFVGFTKSGQCEQVNGHQVQAQALGGFYGSSSAAFYSPDTSRLMYESSFASFTVETIFNRRLALDFDEADLGYPFKFYFELNNPDVSATLEYCLASWPLVNGERDWKPTSGNIGALEDDTYLFRIFVPQHYGTIRPTITDIGYFIDLPDVVEVFEDLAIASTPTNIPIAKTYRKITHITLTLQDDGSGASSAKVVSKSAASPSVRAYNSAGSPVATIMDILVRGY